MDRNHIWFPHMDEDWMHRIYMATASGRIFARSAEAYFNIEDAKAAIAMSMQTEIILAEAA